MKRFPTILAAVLVALSLAFAGLALAGRSPAHQPSMDERVANVAAGLRCPSCQGESVADSQSDVAQGMRAQIRSQLRAGRTPEQIRAWFAQRYGDSVLLTPPRQGVGALVWVLPAVLLGVGLVAVAVVVRRRKVLDEEPASDESGGVEPADEAVDEDRAVEPTRTGRELKVRRATVAAAVVGLLAVAVPGMWRSSTPSSTSAQPTSSPSASPTMDAQSWLRLAVTLEDQGSYDAASRAYRKALEGRPPDTKWIEVRLAFTLLRGGHPGQALPVAEDAAKCNRNPEAVLILGLAQRANHRPEATHTLKEFLRLDPHNPAAPQVRRLLRESP